VLVEGAVSCALSIIETQADVYLCQHFSCDKSMKPHGVHAVLEGDVPRKVQWEDLESRGAWLRAASTTEALFSFMSIIIVRRAFWLQGRLVPEYAGSCWAHVARFLEQGIQRMHVEFVPLPLISQRGENDSFRSSGLIARYALAVDGFSRLVNDFLRDSPNSADHVLRCLRREISPSTLAMARLLVADDPASESRVKLHSLTDVLYPRHKLSTWLHRAIVVGTPEFVLRVIRSAWMRFRPDTPFSRLWHERLGRLRGDS
jgi:abequosyltransferase